MLDGLLSAVIASVSMLIGVVIAQFFGFLNRKSEEKRWYAQYFLDLKIDTFKRDCKSIKKIFYMQYFQIQNFNYICLKIYFDGSFELFYK